MQKLKRVAATVAATVTTVAGLLTMGGTAHAYTPEGVCGSGYTVRATMPVGEGPNATIYLLRNGSSACVVTFKTGSSVGNTVPISAWVESSGGTRRSDYGNYKYYAGPVKMWSSCVNWGGRYGEYTNHNSPC